jgi:hypothetical protein
MARCLELASHLPTEELDLRYQACRDSVDRNPRQLLWLGAQGHHCPAGATLVGSAGASGRPIGLRDIAGVADRRHANPDAPPLLSFEARESCARC